MALLDRLMREARKSMRARGHNNLSSVKWDTEDKIINPNGRVGATLFCDDCMMEANVIPKPQPNEIQIGGEAVAQSCHVATKSPLQRGTEIHQAMERSLRTNPDNRERYSEIRLDAVMGC